MKQKCKTVDTAPGQRNHLALHTQLKLFSPPQGKIALGKKRLLVYMLNGSFWHSPGRYKLECFLYRIEGYTLTYYGKHSTLTGHTDVMDCRKNSCDMILHVSSTKYNTIVNRLNEEEKLKKTQSCKVLYDCSDQQTSNVVCQVRLRCLKFSGKKSAARCLFYPHI